MRTSKKSDTTNKTLSDTAATELVNSGFLQWKNLPSDATSECVTNDSAGFYCDAEKTKFLVIRLTEAGQCPASPDSNKYVVNTGTNPDVALIHSLETANSGLSLYTNIFCRVYSK